MHAPANAEGDPKLFEFNCDTPTSMLEAAVIQWDWRRRCSPSSPSSTACMKS
ncbi:glutathionylspermidine synthase family protein [Sphingomonas cannabina]|uniref:glutathionylspermidine synthase family protein n=1 Tax=Sphingomonas cannabina TaxID=2899123 RepID=UPI003872EC5E